MFNWKWEGLDQVMDWVAVAGAVSAVVLLIIEIIRGINEKRMLSKEHNGLSKEHEGLSKEHEGLSKEFSHGYNDLRSTNIQILRDVNAIDKFLAVEAAHKQETDRNLTNNQQDIRVQIDAIQRMVREMESLQNRIVKLEQENKLLRTQNQELIHKSTKKRSRTYDDEQEF